MAGEFDEWGADEWGNKVQHHYKIVLSTDPEARRYGVSKFKYTMIYLSRSIGEHPHYRLGARSDFRGELRQKAISEGRTFQNWWHPRQQRVFA
jgi:hypothetical protein